VDDAALRSLLAMNLRAAAEKKGVTLTALADFAAVSRAQVFNVVACRTSPTLDWLSKVATALDMEPWQLLAPRAAAPAKARTSRSHEPPGRRRSKGT
jgi:lambda repressor-like predicted transcriptional regulator